jgi:hypothetical protein
MKTNSKTITKKGTLTKVANKIEKDIRKAVDIFTDEIIVERENNDRDVDIRIYEKDSHNFDGIVLEHVQEAIKPYLDMYDIRFIYYTIETRAYYCTGISEFLHAPVVRVTIQMRRA